MKLTIEHSDAAFDIPLKGVLRIGNDEDCQVQLNRPEVWGVHALITDTGYGYVLKIESAPIRVNGERIENGCLLYAGDGIEVSDIKMYLVDDNYIPKTVKQTDAFEDQQSADEHSSVFGIRPLSGAHNGQFVKSHFHHADGWHIYRSEGQLALVTNNQSIRVNGQSVENIWLKNGDRIAYKDLLLRVECPGHSGFSKFSPSHPRNVMLSESLNETSPQPAKTAQSWRTHSWWITLLLGLLLLIVVILSLS